MDDESRVTPGHSNLIGPEAEWVIMTDGEEFRSEESRYWWIVEDIITSIPGTYEQLPWEYTEKAARLLMM